MLLIGDYMYEKNVAQKSGIFQHVKDFITQCFYLYFLQDVEQIQMALDYGENVFKSIKEVHPDVCLGKLKGMYLERKPENAKPFLVSLTSGFIKNERIYFQTKGDDHLIDLKLNCRENLTLSTARVDLQIRRVKDDDDDDVGDLALIKFGTTDVSLRQPIYPAVCEALILSKFFILFIVYCTDRILF